MHNMITIFEGASTIQKMQLQGVLVTVTSSEHTARP